MRRSPRFWFPFPRTSSFCRVEKRPEFELRFTRRFDSRDVGVTGDAFGAITVGDEDET